MSEEEDLEAIGAPPKMSRRTLVMAVLVGVLAGLMIAGAAWWRSSQDEAPAAEAAP